MAQPCGLLLVDKPRGPTSHDVVAAVRRAAKERRVGHAGTLDPLATGLLLVCLGPATRISEYLVGHRKGYEVEARLGVTTDTLDAEGMVTSRWEGSLPTDAEISEAVDGFRGDLLQMPPAYSAVKVGGKPLYRYAREGRPVVANPRPVTIYDLEWRRLGPETIHLSVDCSSGTYVRSLVHDIGQRLNCGAHVTGLRRVRSGPFDIAAALPLPRALERLESGDTTILLDITQALTDLPRIEMGAEAVAYLRQGRPVAGEGTCAPSVTHIAVDRLGSAVAMVEWWPDIASWRPVKVFPTEMGPCLTS